MLEVLGATISLIDGRLRLTDDKRRKYLARVRATIELKSMPKTEYLRLMGRLQFAAQMYPMGRQWLHAAWRVARARFRLAGDRVQITSNVRRDLRRWACELERKDHDGVPLASVPGIPPAGDEGSVAIYDTRHPRFTRRHLVTCLSRGREALKVSIED